MEVHETVRYGPRSPSVRHQRFDENVVVEPLGANTNHMRLFDASSGAALSPLRSSPWSKTWRSSRTR